MKTIINLVALVLACGCSSAFADGPRFRMFRVTRYTVPVQATPVVQSVPMANPAVCTCGPVCPCVQSASSDYVVVSTAPAYIVSTPFFNEHPVADAVVNTVQAPFLFFQENQPVRNVIKSIPSLPVCKDGKCPR